MEEFNFEINDSPKNSPYSSRCSTIRLQGGVSWSIHHGVLRRSLKLASLCGRNEPDVLDLSDISEDTGHVLVHYLYTGTYQSLQSEQVSSNEQRISRFKSTVSVYTSARAFDLPILEAAAKTRIKRFGEDLPVLSRLNAARDVYPNLGDDDTWFLDYLKTCINLLFEELPRPLRSDSLGFLGDVSTFTKALVKSVIELCWEKTMIPGMGDSGDSQRKQFEEFELISTPVTCASLEVAPDLEPELAASEESRPESITGPAGPAQFGASLTSTKESGLMENAMTSGGNPKMPCQLQVEHIVTMWPDQAQGHSYSPGSQECKEIDENLVQSKSTNSTPFTPKPNHDVGAQGRHIRPPLLTTNSSCSAKTMERSPNSAVCDIEGDDSTQATIEESSQNSATPCHQCTNTLQDSYSPTSSEIQVLDELFSEYEASLATTKSPTATQETRYSSTTLAASTEYSSSPELTDIMTPSEEPMRPELGMSLNPNLVAEPAASSLEDCLNLIWPKLPPGLECAPLAAVWEVLRVLLHCSVDPGNVKLGYDYSWEDQDRLWESLKAHPSLLGRPFPEKSDAQAWHDSIHGNFSSGERAVVFTASVGMHRSRTEALMKLELHPLKREKSCRLYRRFGSDRFLQLLFPSVQSWKVPYLEDEEAERIAAQWLTRGRHSLVGRRWTAFWMKGAGKKAQAKKTRLGPDPKPIFQDRIYLFAEDGQGFTPAATPNSLPPKNEILPSRTECKREVMLDWLLQFGENTSQPCLELFSRIQLGLTKTTPIVVLEQHQIRRDLQDRRSPTKQLMNDGIGRISPSLMKRIRDVLCLTDTPCAIQARIGGAKGMWITSELDIDIEDWIEIYPNQLKWNCNWSDEDHRTLEVKNWASELRPANLNIQLLPILDDRSIDKQHTRKVVGEHLANELRRDLECLKSALKHPEQFRKWIYENTSYSPGRVDGIPFLAGLPDNDANILTFLVDGGFDPMKQKFLLDLVFGLQKQKCQKLRTELKIKIARSTYAYMVIDFLGVLEPNEVHLCFSKSIDGYSDLHGLDVLVARCPAHLPSDIQKVKAVFKQELRHLKDVIIFSSKGDVPLADELSGGDYDGDRAWICWDSDIVDSFRNTLAKPEDILPPKDVLSTFFEHNRTTVEDLILRHGEGQHVDAMMDEAFSFGLKRSLLGICTNYKERFCYQRNRIDDEPAILLGWLLSKLADQVKKGIIFTDTHWERFRTQRIGGRSHLPEPAYKAEVFRCRENPSHIVDHLRSVAESVVEKALRELDRFMVKDRTGLPCAVYAFDVDLAGYWNQLENHFARREGGRISQPTWMLALSQGLKADLQACVDEWRILMSKKTSYRPKVLQVYERWRNIKPHIDGEPHLRDFVTAFLLQQDFLPPELSQWELLKASMTFKLYHKISPKFLWQIAGRQLQCIKALRSSSGVRGRSGFCSGLNEVKARCGGLPVSVVSHMYGALKPDNKYISQLTTGGRGMSWESTD